MLIKAGHYAYSADDESMIGPFATHQEATAYASIIQRGRIVGIDSDAWREIHTAEYDADSDDEINKLVSAPDAAIINSDDFNFAIGEYYPTYGTARHFCSAVYKV